jgi:Sensors of blue-light using FAD
MPLSSRLHELIYVSHIEPAQDIRVVAEIARQARVLNRPRMITGLLVFDGERFCQYLEGGCEEVVALFERIRADTRHTGVQLLHQGPVGSTRFRQFSVGFSTADDDTLIGDISRLEGVAVREFFLAMLPSIEMEF